MGSNGRNDFDGVNNQRDLIGVNETAGGAVGGGDDRQVLNNRPNHVDGLNDDGISDATNKRPNHVNTSNDNGNGGSDKRTNNGVISGDLERSKGVPEGANTEANKRPKDGSGGPNSEFLNERINYGIGGGAENGFLSYREDNINSSNNNNNFYNDRDNNRPNMDRFFNNPYNREGNIRSGAYNSNRPNNGGYNNDYYSSRNNRDAEFTNNVENRSGYNYNRSNNGMHNNDPYNVRNNRDADITSSTYQRPNNGIYGGMNNRDDNNTSSEYNRPKNGDYYGGARPRTNNDTDRQRPRLSIFEDIPRQRQFIFEDDPRQGNRLFENRQDYYRGEGRNTIPTPLLHEFREFSTWESCVLAWQQTTELPRYKQGYVLANDLPKDSDRYGNSLREDLFKACPPHTLINNDNGVELVLKFLRTRFYVDEEKEIFEVKRQMSQIKRQSGQNINQFIIQFDNLHEKAKQLGIEIQNDRLLALTLFECANLDPTEETVVRGIVQFLTKDGKRYETVKRKLRDVCSRLNEKQNKNNEDTFLTQNSNAEDDIQNNVDQIYLAKGWLPPKQQQGGQNRNFRQNAQNRPNYGQNNSNNGRSNTMIKPRTKNPIGADGKPMKCHICGSTMHFVKQCPDAYENIRKVGKTKRYKSVMIVTEAGEEKEILKECSDSETEKTEIENVHCTVLCSDNKEEMSNFTAEALNMAALDTCCTSSVAGEKWLRIYLESLPKEMKQKVKGPTQSTKQFIFGNQGKLKSTAKYTIPTKIGGCDNEITLDIIKSDIPLLLSKSEMKKLGITLNMKDDSGTINGKPLVLATTAAGHYIVDLLQESEMLEAVNIAELEIDNETEQSKALSKLHKQFGHRPKKVFVTILKEAGKWNEKFSPMIDKIMEKCEGCLLRRRTPDRPAVAPPMSNDFGQILTLDLKVWDMNKGIYIMYMIDQFTRFQVASVIRSKEPKEIVKTLLLKWLPIFGRVEKILSDNGTEFCNEEMREVASALNIQLLTTGAHSPWQNPINERNHGITDSIVKATLRDYPKMSLEVALAWAITAVNSMSNVRGFSPYQLVFGRQIKLPNILDDPPPAWEEPTKSKSLLETLDALHKARTEYTKAERCERIRKALKAKIRIADTIYENGDIVYFKKEGEESWKGPAKVVFQDSKVIFIRVGSIYYRVSANRLIKAGDELAKDILKKEKSEDIINNKVNDDENETHKEKVTTNKQHHTRSRQREIDQMLDEQEQTSSRTPNKSSFSTVYHEDNNLEGNDEVNKEQQEPPATTIPYKSTILEHQENEKASEEPINIQESTEKHVDEHEHNEQVTEDKTSEKDSTKIPLHNSKGRKRRKVSQKPTPCFNEDGTLQNAMNVLKRNDRIEILEKGKWEKGKILSHGGKVGGRNAGWFNIELDNGEVFHDEVANRDIRYETEAEQTVEDDEVLTVIKLDNGKSLKFNDIDKQKIRIEAEEETAIIMICEEILAVMVPKEKRNSPECLQAKFEELNKLIAFDTYKIVEDKGQDRITTTWVLTEKGNDIRARLTARGFQEDTDFPTDSPTVQKASIRLLAAIAAANKWTIHTTDISSAFLQGSQMDRDVFVEPPKEANQKGKLWKLLKCLYGLKDASRKWYMRILAKLKELGFKKSPLDKGMFYLIKDGNLIGMVGIHVDDFFYAGNKEFMEKIMPEVLNIFKVGKSESTEFMYTGFHFKQDSTGITIDQDKYIDSANIPDVNAKNIKDKDRDMTQEELTMLRQITGVLNWTVRATRPDLAFDCVDLSTNFKGGPLSELVKAQKCAIRMKKDKVAVRISDLENLNDCQIWMFSDAAFRNLNKNTDSCGGFVIFLVNIKNGKSAVIEWKANKLRRKVHSTLGAEAQVLSLGIDAALGVKTQIKEMTNGKIDLKVRAITDNESTRAAIYSESEVQERMLRADIAILKDMIEDGRILEVRWVAGKDMLADVLTKRGVNKAALLDVIQNGKMPQRLLDLILY